MTIRILLTREGNVPAAPINGLVWWHHGEPRYSVRVQQQMAVQEKGAYRFSFEWRDVEVVIEDEKTGAEAPG